MTKILVITGMDGTGKTSIIQRLAASGELTEVYPLAIAQHFHDHQHKIGRRCAFGQFASEFKTDDFRDQH